MNEGSGRTQVSSPIALPRHTLQVMRDKSLWDLLDQWESEERTASRRRKKIIGKQADQLWEVLNNRVKWEGGVA